MGLVKKGKIANYWSTNPLYKNEVAPSIMSRNRFQELLRYIHFVDNVTIDPTDRRAKIQALVDLLQSKFQELYTPEENIVIDESLIPWRGRLIFRQYKPSKAHMELGYLNFMLDGVAVAHCRCMLEKLEQEEEKFDKLKEFVKS